MIAKYLINNRESVCGVNFFELNALSSKHKGTLQLGQLSY